MPRSPTLGSNGPTACLRTQATRRRLATVPAAPWRGGGDRDVAQRPVNGHLRGLLLTAGESPPIVTGICSVVIRKRYRHRYELREVRQGTSASTSAPDFLSDCCHRAQRASPPTASLERGRRAGFLDTKRYARPAGLPEPSPDAHSPWAAPGRHRRRTSLDEVANPRGPVGHVRQMCDRFRSTRPLVITSDQARIRRDRI